MSTLAMSTLAMSTPMSTLTMSTPMSTNESLIRPFSVSTMEIFVTDSTSALDSSAGLITTTNASGTEMNYVSDTEALIMSIFLNIIAVLGMVGNTVVILAVLFSLKLQTVTNVFVIALAVTDLLVCVTLPFQTVALVSPPSLGWPLHPGLCAAIGGITSICFGASVLLLVLIAVNRFCVITRPRKTCRRFYKARNLALMVSMAYLYTLVMFVVLPVSGVGKLGYSPSYRICAWDEDHELGEINDVIVAFTFGVSFFVIIICYVGIFRFVREHHIAMIAQKSPNEPGDPIDDITSCEQTETLPTTPSYVSSSRSCNVNVNAASSKVSSMRKAISRREVEITKNLFYVICSFFVCIVPYSVCLALQSVNSSVSIFTGILLMLNACINPFIYSFKHPTFKVIIRCMVCCRLASISKPSPILKKLLQNSRNNTC